MQDDRAAGKRSENIDQNRRPPPEEGAAFLGFFGFILIALVLAFYASEASMSPEAHAQHQESDEQEQSVVDEEDYIEVLFRGDDAGIK